MDAPRILLVEDHAPLRAALSATLRARGYEVQALPDGRDVPAALDRFRPDLAILDVWLPEGPDGFGLARLIRNRSDLPILFLTAAAQLSDRLAGFESGADDYVTKPFPMAEVLARIEALLRRAGRVRSAVHQVADVLVDEGARTVTRAGEEVALTPTEFGLLLELVRQPGKVLSKRRLLSLVWDREDHDVNVVEAHVSGLRRKLEAGGADRIVHTVRGGGYVVRA